MNQKKVKVEGEERTAKALKRVVLNRNGQRHANSHEVSVLKAGQFKVGQHVMLGIKGDCCYHSTAKREYVVTNIEPCNSFGGGREVVTFYSVEKLPAKKGGAK